MPAFIETLSLAHAYQLEDGSQVWALRGVDLTIDRGEFVAIVGSNGSGKSTLARHLNALLLPTSGEVRVDGMVTAEPEHVPAIRERVGMVFQNPENQLVASTVEEDVAFGPENLGLPRPEIRHRVDEALGLAGLEGQEDRPPHMLSGGQKQRVAIAGVLAMRPACIVLDEPTSMLDPAGSEETLRTMRRLARGEGITIVLITQSMEEAALADRVVVLRGGEVVLDGSPADVFSHEDDLAAAGLGLPAVAEIGRHLRERGIHVPPGLMTVPEMVGFLC
jgi:energy-coupling factor transport system ATP-binding protein